MFFLAVFDPSRPHCPVQRIGRAYSESELPRARAAAWIASRILARRPESHLLIGVFAMSRPFPNNQDPEHSTVSLAKR